MTGESAGPPWPTSPPSPAEGGLHWQLRTVAELPKVRSELCRGLATHSRGDQEAT